MAFKMKKFSGFKELVGNQSKIDMNKDGKLSKVDFEMLGNKSPNKIITYPTPSGPPTSTASQTGIDPTPPSSTGSTSSSTISNVKPQTLGGPSGNTAVRPTPSSPSSISPVKPQSIPSGPQHSALRPTPPGGNKPFEDEGNPYVGRKKSEVPGPFTKKEEKDLKASLKQVEESKISSMNQDERKKDQAKQSSALKMLGIKKK